MKGIFSTQSPSKEVKHHEILHAVFGCILILIPRFRLHTVLIMKKYYVYKGTFRRDSLPDEPRPDSVKISPGVGMPSHCLQGIHNYQQIILTIPTFDRRERAKALRWINECFCGETYWKPEESEPETTQDAQLSFIPKKQHWRG